MNNRCPHCDVEEGQHHVHGCDKEQCPFCGHQLISCDCCYEQLGIDCSEGTWAYYNGLTDEQFEEWKQLLSEKGFVPFFHEPLRCDDCSIDTSLSNGNGEWYMVKDDIWRTVSHGVAPHFLCIGCLDT